MSAKLPFLNTGVTFAFLRVSGYELHFMLTLRMVAKCLAMTGAESFKYLAPMSSMPVALVTFRFWSSFKIKDSVTKEIENSGLFSNFGFKWFFILFKSAFSSELLFAVLKVLCIEVKKLLNVFAPISGSTIGLPSSSLIKYVHDFVDLPVRSCKVFQRCFGLLLLFMESKYNFDFEFRIKVLTLFLQSVY